MANDKEFINYVVDQISTPHVVRFRHMFGGTTLYCNDKVVALICDNQLFIKPTAAGRAYIGDVVEAPPYEGANNSFLIGEKIDDGEWLSGLIGITEAELPVPKLRKKKR
jgi:TfoX/Sxy family transcriptional regulator of competence genes